MKQQKIKKETKNLFLIKLNFLMNFKILLITKMIIKVFNF